MTLTGTFKIMKPIAFALLFFLAACGSKEEPAMEELKEFDGRHSESEQRIESLKSRLFDDPENAQLLAALGDAYFESERYQEAIKIYDKVVKIDPKNADCLNDRGLAYFYLGNNDAALESIDAAISADPAYKHPWLSKGFVLVTIGRYEEAVPPLKKAREIDPGGPIAIEADKFLAQIEAMKGNQ